MIFDPRNASSQPQPSKRGGLRFERDGMSGAGWAVIGIVLLFTLVVLAISFALSGLLVLVVWNFVVVPVSKQAVGSISFIQAVIVAVGVGWLADMIRRAIGRADKTSK